MNYGMFLLKVPLPRATFSHVSMRGTSEKQELIEEGRESIF